MLAISGGSSICKNAMQTVCLPWTNSFFVFLFYVSNGMPLKVIVESSLLSKSEPLAPNIDKGVGG